MSIGGNLDVLEPEKEPVQFTVNTSGLPDEYVHLSQQIKQTAEKCLYHWKTFPIILPPPLVTPSEGEGSLRRRTFNMRDLFVAPSFDELDAVAVDGKGDPRRLSDKQLESVRDKGEFEVDSLNFPNQVHRWRLSALIQKGAQRAHETLLNNLALALRFILVTAKWRITGPFFSCLESLKSAIRGLLKLLDLVIGVPSLRPQKLDEKLYVERSRYLVAELLCQAQQDEDLYQLCQFLRHQIKKSSREKYALEEETYPVIPYLFQTPKGTSLDLRLFNKDLMKKALPVVAKILEKEARGWFLHFRERIVAQLKLNKLTNEEIEREANRSVMDEYLQRVFTSIRNNGDNDDPLCLESPTCIEILHRMEDWPQPLVSYVPVDLQSPTSPSRDSTVSGDRSGATGNVMTPASTQDGSVTIPVNEDIMTPSSTQDGSMVVTLASTEDLSIEVDDHRVSYSQGYSTAV